MLCPGVENASMRKIMTGSDAPIKLLDGSKRLAGDEGSISLSPAEMSVLEEEG